MRLLGEHYSALHPEITFKVLPSLGTTGGIRALNTGVLDIAIASRRLKESEQVEVDVYPLGKSPFVFAVHPTTSIEDVSLPDIVRIYDGTTSRWPDGGRLRRILRPPHDSDWQFMHQISPEMAKSLEISQKSKGLYLAVTDIDALSYIERVRGSFGPTTLTMVRTCKRNVKVLSFNSIPPDVDDQNQQEYPLAKPYYLVSKSGASQAVVQFLDFVFSAEGREILSSAGIVTGHDEQ
jgi:phosphate transport system substrate-binding protein